eukprot:2655475-Prymnesium_polylepis.1
MYRDSRARERRNVTSSGTRHVVASTARRNDGARRDASPPTRLSRAVPQPLPSPRRRVVRRQSHDPNTTDEMCASARAENYGHFMGNVLCGCPIWDLLCVSAP